MAYTNPFSSYKQNKVYFATIVFGVSFATSVALMSMGDRVYGLSSLGIAWIQDRRDTLSPSYAKMILFYLILMAIFVYCLWANFQFNKTDERGFSRTVSNRISIMRRSKKYTVGYVAFGSVVLLIEFISFCAAANETAVGPIPAYFYCFRGVWALLVICYSNWPELTWRQMNPFRLGDAECQLAEKVAQEGLLLQPHLNTALRAEILYFTTQGIMYAAREFEARAAEEGTPHRRKRNRHPGPDQGGADVEEGVRKEQQRGHEAAGDDGDEEEEEDSVGGELQPHEESRMYSFDDRFRYTATDPSAAFRMNTVQLFDTGRRL